MQHEQARIVEFLLKQPDFPVAAKENVSVFGVVIIQKFVRAGVLRLRRGRRRNGFPNDRRVVFYRRRRGFFRRKIVRRSRFRRLLERFHELVERGELFGALRPVRLRCFRHVAEQRGDIVRLFRGERIDDEQIRHAVELIRKGNEWRENEMPAGLRVQKHDGLRFQANGGLPAIGVERAETAGKEHQFVQVGVFLLLIKQNPMRKHELILRHKPNRREELMQLIQRRRD